MILSLFFSTDTATTEHYTLSLHDALPICRREQDRGHGDRADHARRVGARGHHSERVNKAVEAEAWKHRLDNLLDPARSEEHTSELHSRLHLVCRLLLEKKK